MMEVLSRDFSRKEKALLLALALVLLGAMYYKLVDEPVRTNLECARANLTILEEERNALDGRLELMREREKELEEIKSSDNAAYMESYNAGNLERAFLNSLLEDTEEYSLSFFDPVLTGQQVRRGFSLRYIARDYESAQTVLETLYRCELRCLIEDVEFSQNDGDDTLLEGPVLVSLTATFYETMVGGTADAGLTISK